MAEELRVVATASGEAEANVIRATLVAQGIDCMLMTHITQSVWPLSVDGLGQVRVMVRPEDEERARQIIRNCDRETK